MSKAELAEKPLAMRERGANAQMLAGDGSYASNNHFSNAFRHFGRR
jgi:hypothetical protein